MASTTALATTAVLAALAAAAIGAHTPLGHLIWPPAPLAEDPSGPQTAGFVFASLWEAVGFGVGLALTMALWRPFAALAGRTSWAKPAYWALAWLNLSWVPHDNLHITVGADPAGLVLLELVFHTTLIAAGLVVAAFVLRLAKASSWQASTSPPAAVGTVQKGAR